jgi:nitrile hydratase beta subunit
MDGVHDMGGMQCYGAIKLESDEPAFHDDWERKVFALTLAAGGCRQWSLDAMRYAREQVDPATYLTGGYYRIWLESLTSQLVSSGLVSHEELAAGRSLGPAKPVTRLLAADVPQALSRGAPTLRTSDVAARFSVGDWVKTINAHPVGHTRLPRYCRGRIGTVASVHGVHIFPDTNATGAGEQPTWLYSVRFDARVLWGPDTSASSVFVDLWEPYLEIEA